MDPQRPYQNNVAFSQLGKKKRLSVGSNHFELLHYIFINIVHMLSFQGLMQKEKVDINGETSAQFRIVINKIVTHEWPQIKLMECKQAIHYIYFSFLYYYVHINRVRIKHITIAKYDLFFSIILMPKKSMNILEGAYSLIINNTRSLNIVAGWSKYYFDFKALLWLAHSSSCF